MARNYSSISEVKTLAANVPETGAGSTQVIFNEGTTGLPAVPFVLVLNPDTTNEEVVLATALTGSTYTITRNIEGGGLKSHTANQEVRHMIVGSDLQLVHNHLDNTTTAHGVSGAVVGTNSEQILTLKRLTTPKINENVNLTATSTELNVLDGITASTTELNYVDGVTSAIQTQIDTKAPSAGPTFTGTVVLPSTTSIGNVSATEIGYVDGVTSAIQTQLNTIVNTTIPAFVPTGTVNMWVTGTAPTGWLLCDGTEKLVSAYPTLASVIGTNYGALTNGSGGAGTTHFRVPDLRSRVPMGIGTGTTVDHNNPLTARSFNATNRSKVSNDESVTLTEAQIPSHRHTNTRNTQTTGAQGAQVYGIASVGDFSEPDVTTFTGGGQAHNNTQPSTVINFIIKH
jgi:microcystin-dependent protein